MKKSVDTAYQSLVTGLSALIVMPLFTILVKLIIFKNLSFFVLLVQIVLWTLEDFLLKTVLNNLTKSRVKSALLNAAFFGVQLVLGIILGSSGAINPKLVYISSLLPYMQLQWFGQLSLIAGG